MADTTFSLPLRLGRGQNPLSGYCGIKENADQWGSAIQLSAHGRRVTQAGQLGRQKGTFLGDKYLEFFGNPTAPEGKFLEQIDQCFKEKLIRLSTDSFAASESILAKMNVLAGWDNFWGVICPNNELLKFGSH